MDSFKESFKYYKSRKSPPDFSHVLNFHNLLSTKKESTICSLKGHSLPHELEKARVKLNITKPSEWNIYSLNSHPGLIIICNAFSNESLMMWIKRCLQQFTESPYKTNLSNLGISFEEQSWWSTIKGSLLRNKPEKLVNQLRWSTIGYHHNWDTKEYSEADKTPVPDEVKLLCTIFLSGIGYPNTDFEAEAAIINYYPAGSTLSPHTDHSEPNKEAPLLSFSFGRSGLFLIGGSDKETKPTPLFLHHGDVMVMSRSSRLCYHAVPRIMSKEDVSDIASVTSLDSFLNHWNFELEDLKAKRIANKGLNHKELVYEENILAILNYIKSFRINFNVRQVHL